MNEYYFGFDKKFKESILIFYLIMSNLFFKIFKILQISVYNDLSRFTSDMSLKNKHINKFKYKNVRGVKI